MMAKAAARGGGKQNPMPTPRETKTKSLQEKPPAIYHCASIPVRSPFSTLSSQKSLNKSPETQTTNWARKRRTPFDPDMALEAFARILALVAVFYLGLLLARSALRQSDHPGRLTPGTSP